MRTSNKRAQKKTHSNDKRCDVFTGEYFIRKFSLSKATRTKIHYYSKQMQDSFQMNGIYIIIL